VNPMADRSFNFKKLKEQFGIQPRLSPLFPQVQPIEPSPWLMQTLVISSATTLTTEKERSERIISPILLELREHNARQFSVLSGLVFDVDAEKGLNGECDFILSRNPFDFEIQAPVFTLVEAKKGDIESGLPQCTAQMIAAEIFNRQEGTALSAIYGAVTTGDVWRFLKLNGSDGDWNLQIDSETHYLDNLPVILGILQSIVEMV
jgi:hypothetical protein